MLRLLLFFCTISFACSCNTGVDSDKKGAEINADSLAGKDFSISPESEKVLSRFQSMPSDTLHIVPFIEKRSDKIEGLELDSIERNFFPGLPAYGAAAYTPKIYAAGKWNIGDRYVGLLARTMSFYAPTSMKLYVYDKKSDSITGSTELADQFGDGGAYGEKESWLFEEAGTLTAVLAEFDAVDHTLDVPPGDGIDSTYSYYKIQFANGKPDTISVDNVALKKAYPRWLLY